MNPAVQIRIAILFLSGIASAANANEIPKTPIKFDRDRFVKKLLKDLDNTLQDLRGQDCGFLLKAAIVLQERKHQCQLAGIIRKAFACPSALEKCGRTLTLVAPRLLPLDCSPQAVGFPSEVLRQRYVLRGFAAHLAQHGDEVECRSLYAMSNAGRRNDPFSLDEIYRYSLFNLAHFDRQSKPPEFAIGHSLAIAEKSTEWTLFVNMTDGFEEIFARAGWAAGCIEIGQLAQGRLALRTAIDILEQQPSILAIDLVDLGATTKANTVLALAQLLSNDVDNPMLDDCVEAFLHQRNVVPELTATAHSQFAGLYEICGNPMRATKHLAVTQALIPKLDPFAATKVESILAMHDARLGRTQAALERTETARSSVSPSTRVATYQVLSEVAKACAQQELSWSETNSIIKIQNDIESIWTRLGWLQGITD